MRSGGLRKRLTIQYKTYSVSTIGEETVTWADEDTVWAQIKPLVSRAEEFLAMQQVQSDTTHMVTVRFRNALNHDKRFLYGASRVLKIQRVVDLNEDHQWLACFCTEEAL